MTYDNAAKYTLNIPADFPTDSDVAYSCPGFILLGIILEKVYGKRLDAISRDLVFKPPGMSSTGFMPKECKNIVNSNFSENMLGTVNDYNAQHLGCIAGNAGVFSNMTDMKRFAKMLLEKGNPIISEKTFDFARQNLTPGMSAARGLGFLYVDERYKQTGNLFPKGSFGHCGHTGQSVFVNVESGLSVIILSDTIKCAEKKCGKPNYDIVKKMREDIHNAINEDI